MQDGEPFLAGTAPEARALISPRTAASFGFSEGESVRVSAGPSAMVVPVSIREMADDVIWLPTNSAGSTVRSTLGVDAGAAVNLIKGGVA
jgi:NADH-quinone oxidoreductase subunit G